MNGLNHDTEKLNTNKATWNLCTCMFYFTTIRYFKHDNILLFQAFHISKNVSVPTMEDKELTDFFTSKTTIETTSAVGPVKLPTLPSQPNKDLNNVYER